MKQTTKRVLSLLMALTMLIGMMTAVTVSAAVEEWQLVKEVNFEGETPLAGLSQHNLGDKTFDVVTDSATSSAVAHAVKTGSATTPATVRVFNIDNIEVSVGDVFKIEYDVKTKLDLTNSTYYNNGSPFDFRWVSVQLSGGTTTYLNFGNKQGKEAWNTYSAEKEVVAAQLPSGTTTTTTGQILVSYNNVVAGEEIWLDNIKLYKKVTYEAPVVTSVTVDGAAQLGQTLTADVDYTDANGDTATASYQWQVKIDGDWKDISGATSISYQINANETVDGSEVDMLGKQVRVKVALVSDNAKDPQDDVIGYSDETQAITEASTPPSGTGEGIVGDYETYEVGQELTATFTYVPSESNVEEGDAEYIWETSESEEFTEGSITEVQKGTNNKYIVKLADAGKWLRVRIIPKDENGLAGEELIVDAKQVNGDVSFYVSIEEGNDENDGSKDHPFKTIEKARDAIRALEGNLPTGGIVVNIMGGTYPISDTINFTAEDSGTEESPITYQAYNDEKVIFTGGKTLDSSEIEKVTDEDVLDGLVEEDAKDHLYMLDLGDQDVEMDALQAYGDGHRRDLTGYRPKQIYMNNQLLTAARWPNEDQSQNLLSATPVTKDKNADVAAGKLNAASTPIMYGYPDPENRSAKWDIEEGDAYVGGAVVYYWAPTYLRIKEIDKEKKIVTSIDKSSYGSVSDAGWGGQCKIFFSNIFAEIDKPGESYIDRENNILYFYPIGSVENADMVVSTLKKNMISLKEVSYVTFKGIDFKNTVETAVVLKDCDNVTIADAEIANITQSGVDMTNCTDTVIEGSNFYTIGESAIKIIGDDAILTAPTTELKLTTIPENRRTLTPSGNEIRYNNFHNICVFSNNRNTAVDIQYAVGEWIHHNEFNDIDLYTIRMQESNDTLIEYNKFLNLGELNSDAGAINWGREFDSLGHTVRYNYFENIGSKLVSNHLMGHQSASIFVDDAATGGEIYGNVFLNGGSNQTGQGSPVIGNGPEFSNIWGNVSICTDFDRMQYTFRSRVWGATEGLPNVFGVRVPTYVAATSWIYQMKMREPYGKASSNMTKQSDMDMMWSDEWAARYADTQWAAAIEHYSKENYDGAKALFDQEDYAGVLEYLSETLANKKSSKIHNNVSLGAIQEHTDTAGVYDGITNYYGTQHAITEEDKALFVDFDNKDFTLTDAGLAKIKAVAPEFEAINFNEIGFGNRAVGGHKPVVTVKPEIISGVAKAGYDISAAYTFTDADGDAEGNTKIYWYVSETEDGKYKPIYGGDETKLNEFGGVEGKKFEVLEDYTGKYLKYEIVPADTTSLRGETVWSDPIFVNASGAADVSALSDKITAAITLVNNAVAGEEVGQYPQTEIDKLNALIVEAQAMANNPDAYQYQVDAMLEKLTVGVQTFESSAVSKAEFMSIKEMLEDESGWTETRGTGSTLEDGVLTLPVGTAFAYTAEQFDNQIFVFKMKIEEANTEDDVDPIINNSVAFRKTNADAYTYLPDVYLWWMKNYQADESQRQNEAQFRYKLNGTNQSPIIDAFTDHLIELDTEYTIGVGAYDVAGEGVKWVLYIDDMTEPVFERTFNKSEDQGVMYGKDGYFMFGNDGTDIVAKIYAVAEADVTELNTSIENAKALLEKEGDAYGEYPASYIESLENAIAKAEQIAENSNAVQKEVDDATESLNTLVNSAKLNANTQMNVTENGEITIDYDLPEAKFDVDSSVTDFTLQMDPEKEQPAYVFTYEGEDGTVTTEIAKDATFSADGWDGSFDLPILGTTPSEELAGENFTVLSMGEPGKVIESSEIVKIVLPGMAGKSLAYLQDDGSYKTISKNKNLAENTLEAAEAELSRGGVAKIDEGEDMVIYTTYLTELVAYDWRASSTTPSTTPTTKPSVTPNQPIGGQPISPGIAGPIGGSDSSSTKPATKSEFTDIIGHWAENDIKQMADKGIVSGVTATTFEPDRSITRAEFAALITRALRLSSANDNAIFTDVASDDWYADEVAAAAAAGLIVGYDGKFRPNDTITREEMAVVIMKAYKFLGKSPLTGKIDQFADKDSISAWAVDYVDQAVSSGLISGMTANTFAPGENATRAQVASLIKRLLDK